jgi:hypothetical protein
MITATDPLEQLDKALAARLPDWADTLTAGSWWVDDDNDTRRIVRRFELDGRLNVAFGTWRGGEQVGQGSADGAWFAVSGRRLDGAPDWAGAL